VLLFCGFGFLVKKAQAALVNSMIVCAGAALKKKEKYFYLSKHRQAIFVVIFEIHDLRGLLYISVLAGGPTRYRQRCLNLGRKVSVGNRFCGH
jgi:hypothetical protein